IFEQACGAAHVPGMVLPSGRARVVHDAEVDEATHAAGAEHLARLFRAQIDRHVLDVLGATGKRSAIDPDHAAARAAVQALRDQPAETPRDPGQDDLAFHVHQKMRARSLSPTWTIDWTVLRTCLTILSSSSSSTSGSPRNVRASPK